MKIRMFLTAALVAAVAAGALALTPEHSEWAKGPVQFLITKEEAAQWKNVTTDEQAQKFIDLFWARRDPSPNTPANEFRDEFDARVKYADEKFGFRGKRGSLSDRGMLIIVFGSPTRVERSASTVTQPTAGNDNDEQEVSQTWVYENDAAMKNFGVARAEIRLVDRFNSGDFRLERGRVNVPAAQQKVVAAAITQPGLTEVPTYGRAAKPAATVPAPAAAATPAVPPLQAPMTEFKTPAFTTAVAEFNAAKKSPYDKQIFVTYAEGVTSEGEYFVPVSIYVPKAAGLSAGQGLTFFGVVADASGTPVAVFEEPATLTASKDDLYVDKSLKLPAGKFRGTFGLAEAGKPVTMVSTEMNLAGSLDVAAEGTSPLILSNNIYPMSEAQAPTDPFAFGGLKVVPKADKTFSQADDLWYFFEVRNPGLGEDKQPKLQAKIDVEGTLTDGKKTKMSAPPDAVQATEFKGMPNHWGVGSAIPLASFKPGNYTISIKVMDTISKQSYTMKQDFKVVAGAAPAAAPAK